MTSGQKLVNSGHKVKDVRAILIIGIKGFYSKVRKCKREGVPLHRSAKMSSGARRLAKLTGKSNWFRKVRQADDGDEERAAFYSEEQENKPKGKANSPRRDQQERSEDTDTTRPREELRVTSVLFVEQSKRVTLASKMRETLRRLEPLLGFRMKVVENAGTSLGTLLSNRDPWAGTRCGRESCFPCKQKTERIEDCRKANILYESRCCTCNGEEKGKTSLELDDPREHPSIYVGERARTLQERSREHHSDYSK